MGKAIPYDFRVKIIERIQEGESYHILAQEMGYSESGVKKIWYAFKKYGEASLCNKYKNCGRNPLYTTSVHDAIKEIRDNKQGGGYVRSKLEQKYPHLAIPSERTLQRWWVSAGTSNEKGRPRNIVCDIALVFFHFLFHGIAEWPHRTALAHNF